MSNLFRVLAGSEPASERTLGLAVAANGAVCVLDRLVELHHLARSATILQHGFMRLRHLRLSYCN